MFDFLNKLLGGKKNGGKAQSRTAAPASGKNADKPNTSAAADEGINITHLEMIQKMWGDGFSRPGSAEYVLALATPLALDPQKSVLNLSSGLGGFARALAASYKTYVTGFERSEEYAKAGQQISNMTGFSRHATITHYVPEQLDYSKRVDAVIIRELLYTIEDKNDFIKRVAATVKPRGHLLLTDFTCDDADYLNRPPVSLWIESESYPVHLSSAADIQKLLEGYGFDVRINEDMTKEYSRQILFGLSRLTRFLEGKKLNQKTKDLLKKEVDYWARLLGGLNAIVKNTRFYAIKVR